MLGAWLSSTRPASQLYLGLGLAVGWSLARRDGASAPLATLLLLHAYGVLQQLFIVWANDVADEATDALNQTPTPFSGGSRVLVSGTLRRAQLLRAAFVAGVLAELCTVALSWRASSPWPALLGLLGLGLLLGYSFPPLRLSYRGGGVWLQVIGLGLVLPALAYGSLEAHPTDASLLALAALLPAHFACGVATTLPDVPSDTASGKRSFAVAHGAVATTWASTFALLASALALELLGGGSRSLLVLACVLALGQTALGPAPPGSRRLVLRLAHLVGAALTLQLAVALP